MRWMLFPLLLVVTSCNGGPDSWCLTNRPQRPSAAEIAAMTDARVAEVLAYNRLGARRCGWSP